MIERHLFEFRKILGHREIGFFVDEKDDLVFFINYCIKNILDTGVEQHSKEEFVNLLDCFVSICGVPLRERKASDSFLKADSYLAIFSCLGKLLRLSVGCVKPILVNVSKCISELVEKSFDLDFLSKAIKQCSILDDVLFLISHLVKENEPVESDLFIEAVNVVWSISRYEEYAEKMTREGGVRLLIDVINSANFSDLVVFKIIDTIWNIIEIFPKSTLYIGEVNCVTTMFKLIQETNLKGFRTKDKELRNDILIIFSFLAREPENQNLLKECGLLEYLAAISIGLELYPESVTVSYNVSTISNEDFEMKKLAWTILFYLTFNNECLSLIVDLGFVTILLECMDINSEVMRKWNDNQRFELKLLALKILFLLSVRVPQNFSKDRGPEICLELLRNSNEESILSSCFNTLMNVSTQEIGCKDLSQANAIPSMLDACVNNSLSLSSRTDAVRIISNICTFVKEAIEAFMHNGGVAKMLHLLETSISESQYIEKDELIFNVIDCVWCCIVGNSECEQLFIDGDGIHFLLTLLTISNNWIQLSILGCLADFMISNIHAIEESETWLSRDKERLVTFLIKLWRHNENGKIISELWTLENLVVNPDDYDLQRKIYHVLTFLGPRIDMNSLTDSERLEIAKIQQYDKILHDKAWEEICVELEQENIRPTTPDRDLINQKFKEKAEREELMASGKSNFVNEMQSRQLKEEELFYNTIIERNTQKHNSQPSNRSKDMERYTSKSRNSTTNSGPKNISVQSFNIIGGYVNRRAAEEEID
ncbi:hypothetical protein C9374_006915 [Naegleria lovaniensis]|uniref:Cilia- and flagella-associated protein 69 ARM repeats domain-containing protein n=1 Tax=Naegleria lovaniensis TaxID=51637 RepID=A0AA88KS80_NAELO|nr:uncharacterized protein C9374_006915 [Naegleria lovaniensis]KAG2393384.1 hypothetical protein C9374_006915 [Naegleria lovaniensis]